MESYDEFVSKVKGLLDSADGLEIMYVLQKELNEFIEAIRGIDKSDDEKWVKNYTLAMIQEISELIDEFNWKWWTNPKEIDKNAVLEEVVDTVHFLLSVYLQLKKTPEEIGSLGELWEHAFLMKDSEIIGNLVGVLHVLTELYLGRFGNILEKRVWYSLLGVVKSLGFSDEDFFWAYVKKNYENRRRQFDKHFKNGSYYACKKS